jgi:hypothetical protein
VFGIRIPVDLHRGSETPVNTRIQGIDRFHDVEELQPVDRSSRAALHAISVMDEMADIPKNMTFEKICP